MYSVTCNRFVDTKSNGLYVFKREAGEYFLKIVDWWTELFGTCNHGTEPLFQFVGNEEVQFLVTAPIFELLLQMRDCASQGMAKTLIKYLSLQVIPMHLRT